MFMDIFYYCTFLYFNTIKLCLKMYLKLKSQALINRSIRTDQIFFMQNIILNIYLLIDGLKCDLDMFMYVSCSSTGQPHVCSLNEY